MALPVLMQKLFENSGAGPKIRSDILPEVEAGVMTINGKKPDGSGNLAIDVGVKTVNSQAPDSQGNIEVQAGHALGDTWISFDSTVPAGGVPFCGQLVNRTMWADLFAWVTEQGKIKTESEWQEYANAHGGNCPFYSDGDGSGTFRMPKVAAYFKGAESASEDGTWVAEGLPNIEDEVAGAASGLSVGAFQDGDEAIDTKTSGASVGEHFGRGVNFSASFSNSIYGASEHVTPETCVVLVGVWALGKVATTGSSTIDAVASAVASIETNMNKKLPDTTVHIVETWIAEDGNSWYRKYSDGWIEQGGYSVKAGASTTLTFPTAFIKATSYTVQAICYTPSGQGYMTELAVRNYTASTVRLESHENIHKGFFWFACGH